MKKTMQNFPFLRPVGKAVFLLQVARRRALHLFFLGIAFCVTLTPCPRTALTTINTLQIFTFVDV